MLRCIDAAGGDERIILQVLKGIKPKGQVMILRQALRVKERGPDFEGAHIRN